MFQNDKLIEQLEKQHKQIEELILINQTLCKLLETTAKDWQVVAEFVRRNSASGAAFATVR
jgi:hypothetical protein